MSYFDLSYRGIHRPGFGDIKFLASTGLSLGFSGLPIVLLIATMTALARAEVMQLSSRALDARTSLSLGPFLASGLVLTVGLQQLGF